MNGRFPGRVVPGLSVFCSMVPAKSARAWIDVSVRTPLTGTTDLVSECFPHLQDQIRPPRLGGSRKTNASANLDVNTSSNHFLNYTTVS